MTVDELEFLVMGVWARCECGNSILLFASWKDYFVYENKIHDWYKCVEFDEEANSWLLSIGIGCCLGL
jgi:hypothetical protein